MTDLEVYRWIGEVAATASDISVVRTEHFGATTVWFVVTARGEAAFTRDSIERAAERMSVHAAGPWMRLCAAQAAESRAFAAAATERLAAARGPGVPSGP